MASGDWLDLSQAACRAAQFDPSDTTGDLVRAKAAINEANVRVCASGDPWDFLEREGQWDTVADSDVYTYASIASAMSITGSLIREIVMMTSDTEDFVSESMSWQDLERLTASTKGTAEGTGSPTMWAKWASRVRLYPSPDDTYTLGIFAYLTQDYMTADADVPLMPLAWRFAVLVPYAAAILLEQEGGNEAVGQIDRLTTRYEKNLMQMRTACATAKAPTFNAYAPGFFRRDTM